VNNLPKVVTQRHLEQDLNSRHVDRKPKRLTRCTTAALTLLTVILERVKVCATDTQNRDRCQLLVELIAQARNGG